MLKTITLIYVLAFLFSGNVQAQQINGDSIKALLPSTPPGTLLFAQRIQELSQYYRRINPDSALYWADSSLTIGMLLKDHTIIGTAKFLRANVLSDRQHQQEARALYDEALNEFKIVDNQKMLMQTMNNYGATYNRENNYTEARPWFGKSMQIAQRINDLSGQASVLGNIGFIEEMTGDKRRGIELYTQALRLCERAGDWVRVAALYNNIGAVYSNMSDNRNAIKYTRQACQINQKNKLLAPLKNTLYNLVFYYNEADSLTAALQIVEEAEKVSYPATPYQKALGFVIKGQIEERRMNYRLALTLLDSAAYYAVSAPGGLMPLHNASATKARIYLAQKHYEKAIEHARAALDIAVEVNDPVSINLDQKFLAQGYSGLGKTDEALKFLWDFEAGRDSMYSEAKFRAINDTVQQYMIEKKDLELALQDVQIKSKNRLLTFAAFLVLMLGLLGYVQYKRRRDQQRLNQLLQAENERLLENNEELTFKVESFKGEKIPIEEIREFRVVLSNQKRTVLKVGDILYFRPGEEKTVVVRTVDGKDYRELPTLEQYQKLLEYTTAFVRTHRKYLVNRLHITERFPGSLTLTNGESVPIAETPDTRTAVNKWLDEWLKPISSYQKPI